MSILRVPEVNGWNTRKLYFTPNGHFLLTLNSSCGYGGRGIMTMGSITSHRPALTGDRVLSLQHGRLSPDARLRAYSASTLAGKLTNTGSQTSGVKWLVSITFPARRKRTIRAFWAQNVSVSASNPKPDLQHTCKTQSTLVRNAETAKTQSEYTASSVVH
jgi:hypothetical protein